MSRKKEATHLGLALASKRAAGIQVIARMAKMLRCLEKEPNGLSLSRLAKQASLPRSTVQRIVDALATEQFLTPVSQAGGVWLGPALVRLGAAVRVDIGRLARPFLEGLSKKTGETVDLSEYRNGRAIFIDQIVGDHRLRAVSAIGISFPLHCSANGKAILAMLDPGEVERLKQQKLVRITPRTTTSWSQVLGEIRTIHSSRIAFDREEHTVGICAVGSAFFGPDGKLYAISIPTPTQRFVGHEDELSQALLECSVELNHAIRGAGFGRNGHESKVTKRRVPESARAIRAR